MFVELSKLKKFNTINILCKYLAQADIDEVKNKYEKN